MSDSMIATTLARIANAVAELPGIRRLAEPVYRRQFLRFRRPGNACHGVFDTYAEARAIAQSLQAPATYDLDDAGRLYRERLERIVVSDYPSIYWLSRLLDAGERKVFDLGGHIGISYYGFRRYIDYPGDMQWLVHDLPAMARAGRAHALQHDPERRLAFSDQPEAADGCDVLFTSGALQYLDYTLPELLQRLQHRPSHVLVNLTPMHPRCSFFTLQNIRIAICPYRVTAVPEFIAGMESMGYALIDHWQSRERSLRIPFRPGYEVDSYHGFYFANPDRSRGKPVAQPQRATSGAIAEPAVSSSS